MAVISGLDIPVGVSPDGRAKIINGDRQLMKIIGLNLSFADSDNPFQDLGLNEIIFSINDRDIQSIIRQRLIVFFQRLEAEGRASLDEGSVKFIHEEGELILEFLFRNLKTDRNETFRGIYDYISGRVKA